MHPEIVNQIWQELWQEYLERVPYARAYLKMITDAGGKVANDHIALRSLHLDLSINGQTINLGIPFLAAIIERFGYKLGGEYLFPATHLYARHYYHPHSAELNLPKLFISELIVAELPENIQTLIYQIVQTVSPVYLERYQQISQQIPDNFSAKQIFTRPWQPASFSQIQTINQITQYGAWVLLHGYAVNHFTAYVNQQNTSQYPDIQTTANGLKNLGIPMKASIEGSIEVGLRQTATHAVSENVPVIDDITNQEILIPWTYAYYEIAERYLISDPSGKVKLFDAFLGANAQHLFEMTRVN